MHIFITSSLIKAYITLSYLKNIYYKTIHLTYQGKTVLYVKKASLEKIHADRF